MSTDAKTAVPELDGAPTTPPGKEKDPGLILLRDELALLEENVTSELLEANEASMTERAQEVCVRACLLDAPRARCARVLLSMYDR